MASDERTPSDIGGVQPASIDGRLFAARLPERQPIADHPPIPM